MEFTGKIETTEELISLKVVRSGLPINRGVKRKLAQEPIVIKAEPKAVPNVDVATLSPNGPSKNNTNAVTHRGPGRPKLSSQDYPSTYYTAPKVDEVKPSSGTKVFNMLVKQTKDKDVKKITKTSPQHKDGCLDDSFCNLYQSDFDNKIAGIPGKIGRYRINLGLLGGTLRSAFQGNKNGLNLVFQVNLI